MNDATERRAETEGQAVELEELDIAIGSDRHAILALRRKGGNQVETFQIATERLRSACRVLLDQDAIEELRKIRKQLSDIGKSVPLSQEIAIHLFQMMDANYSLPKRGKE